jgi:hypothetical protein
MIRPNNPAGNELHPGVLVEPHDAGVHMQIGDLSDVHRNFPIDQAGDALPDLITHHTHIISV